MDVLSEIGKKITETARAVTKKSEDLLEIAKLNLAIGNEEDRIKKALFEIGIELYKDYIKGEVQEEFYKNKCAEIRQIEENIKVLKEKILQHKGNKVCKSCGAVVSLEVNFCPSCGFKFEKS